MSLIDSLIHTCTIQKRTVAATASIGASYTWTAVFTGIQCWVQPASQREVVQYSRPDLVVTHKVYFKVDPVTYFGNDAAVGKFRLSMTSAPFTGQTFEVRSVAEATAGKGWAWKVMVEYKPADDLT